MGPAIDITEELSSAQSVDGSIASFANFGNKVIEDRNGFATALLVRTLSGDCPAQFTAIRSRALDYLQTCEDPDLPGHFRFWPKGQEPIWGVGRPPDADDTAIMAVELVRHGRHSMAWLRDIALTVLVKHRAGRTTDIRPSRVLPGAFQTWLAKDHLNVVDVVVNANVAAMFAFSNLAHTSAYHDAVEVVYAALDWIAADSHRLWAAAPYYPHPAELHYALEHAVAGGAYHLEGALRRVAHDFGVPDTTSPHRPICSGAHGEVTWTCPALQAARAMLRAYRSR